MPRWYPTRELARPVYYDRDAVPVYANVNATFTPAGATVRASYSPAYPFAAFMETIYLSIRRDAAASAALFDQAFVNFYPYYGGNTRIVTVERWDNVLNVVDKAVVTSYGYMAYGDSLQIYTYSGSIGGSVAIFASIKGTEFYY